jgi:hypothetical protein
MMANLALSLNLGSGDYYDMSRVEGKGCDLPNEIAELRHGATVDIQATGQGPVHAWQARATYDALPLLAGMVSLCLYKASRGK